MKKFDLPRGVFRIGFRDSGNPSKKKKKKKNNREAARAAAGSRQDTKSNVEDLPVPVHSALPPSLQRCATAAQEKGTSAWLTAVPLERHDFALHKGEFRDAIALRYGWPVLRVPEKCVCNAPFSADHAMICRKGGYPTLRHNEVRNLVASALNEVCTDVSLEPRLQPLSGEALPSSANKEDEGSPRCESEGILEQRWARRLF